MSKTKEIREALITFRNKSAWEQLDEYFDADDIEFLLAENAALRAELKFDEDMSNIIGHLTVFQEGRIWGISDVTLALLNIDVNKMVERCKPTSWKHRAEKAEARCTTCDKHDSFFEGEWKQRTEKAEADLKEKDKQLKRAHKTIGEYWDMMQVIKNAMKGE